jgi:alcohol dehydrogenase class IV
MYKTNGCDAIIGLGGGSPIDAAKCVGIRVVKPKVPLKKMKGILKVRKRLPLLIAIPTTAGTGSEATLAAVISDPSTHEKFAISDMPLIPKIAVLDPMLTVGLPPFYTATTGMDALTHAIEAYLGKSNTKETKRRALHAIELVHRYLKTVYDHPNHLDARMNMLLASYHAGFAFTRAYVGNIHAIAHTFGGFYQVPHGYANAIIMPHVLCYYSHRIHKKLAFIHDVLYPDHDGTIKDKALKVIDWIKELNDYFKIPETIDVPNMEHIDKMIDRAHEEANPLYPVPVIFKKKDFKQIYHLVITKNPD